MLIEPAELELATPTPDRPQVLIVDDEETIAEPLRLRLDKLGFGTIVARSGRQALDLARLARPHCITLDLCLPDVDGLELCQQLVDDQQTGEIPVIIVSGRDQADLLRQARAAGCQFYVRKPYDPNVLLTLIRQAIDDVQE
jgi:two-component system cell cycle response regulator DivK